MLTTIQLVGPFGHKPSDGVPALVLKLAVFDDLPEVSPMLRYGIQTASGLHISDVGEEKCQRSFESHFQAED